MIRNPFIHVFHANVTGGVKGNRLIMFESEGKTEMKMRTDKYRGA